MTNNGSEKGTPGSSQDEKAPQDETPGGNREKAGKQTDIGVVKHKPKPGEAPRKSSSGSAETGNENEK
jgi:hypothetical protein